MPYVQMPKDLTKVKTKVAFNLTKRQIICFGLAAVCAVPTYFLTRDAVGNMVAMKSRRLTIPMNKETSPCDTGLIHIYLLWRNK